MAELRFFKVIEPIVNELTKPNRFHSHPLVVTRSNTHVNTAIDSHGENKTLVKVSVFSDEVYTTGSHGDLKVVVVAKRCRELRSDVFKHDALPLLLACRGAPRATQSK